MQANKYRVPLLGWADFSDSPVHLETMEAGRDLPTRLSSARREGQRTAVLDFCEHQRLQHEQTALGGKGQKPCYKLCFQRSALLSKKLASKVLIGPPKINPFNEWINWFRTQTWKNQRKQMSWAICFKKNWPLKGHFFTGSWPGEWSGPKALQGLVTVPTSGLKCQTKGCILSHYGFKELNLKG